jgi:hypothetical protein
VSHPIDVGSVLGGRYKVTATVLTSHDHDLVLDGVDQVLNRPVSILVAGPENTEQVAQSAREVATGERPGHVQVLDLGVSEAATYLITNHTSAAELLDLVVASNPPYVEPFFTDTLGSEIFGQARSHEPEPYDDEENVDAGYINYAGNHQNQVDPHRSAQPVVPPRPPARPTSAPAPGAAGAGSAGAAAGAAAGAGAAAMNGAEARQDTSAGSAAAGSSGARQQATAPQPVQPAPRRTDTPGTGIVGAEEGPASGAPKVSLWSEDDYGYDASDQDESYDDSAEASEPRRSEGLTRNLPSFARSTVPAAAMPPAAGKGDFDDDDEPEREPRSMRWLVGGLLAVVLIAGLVFAVTNLGSLFKADPQANTTPGTSNSTPAGAGSASPTSSARPAAPPAIESITRQGNFDFAATYDVDLVKAFDGNAASYWSDMEFATENWGGLATDGVPLIVKLKDPATVSSVTLTQLGASGGNISVFTNDRPSLDGAKQVGTNSFTSTDLTMPLAAPVEAEYVIVSIKSLPKLAAPKTRYGYGIRLAEIKIQ